MAADDIFMKRALELAELGRGFTSPNPIVGAVLVHNNRVIGEGYHTKYGEQHAEVNAINSVSASDSNKIQKSTLYVNLEPCSHHGQTPPCTNLILQSNIPRVVIANLDPFPDVNGKGVHMLQEKGVKVETGVMQDQGKAINKSFFTYHIKKRPYIILKWAQTKNGIFATKTPQQTWLTGKLAQRLVHRWRAREDAIMVGTETAAIDNPSLTCRLWTGENPTRVVCDNQLRLNRHLNLFDQNATTLVYTTSQETPQSSSGTVQYIHLDQKENFMEKVFDDFYEKGIQSILIEGGAKLLNSLIEANLWDEARVFLVNYYFSGGKSAPQLPVTTFYNHKIEEDDLLVFQNPEAS